MKNKIDREIPDYLLQAGWKPYNGKDALDGVVYHKSGPMVRACIKPQESKVLPSLREAILQCGLRDGMIISFHHHFRDGDYIIGLVMHEIASLGIKNITIAASSLGSAHDFLCDMMESGIVTGLQTSGLRGKIGEAVSNGKLNTPAIIRSHGGRVRAIESGEIHIDIAFLGASTCDEQGNASGKGGKSDCGVLSYADVDAKYADKVVVITDSLVSFPNHPASIHGIDVDYVVVVDQIGDPSKIATSAAKITQDPRNLLLAERCAQVITKTSYFRDGFSFQTGVGGPSIAATSFLRQPMLQHDIHIGLAIGGISKPMVDLLREGLIKNIADTQDFDLDAAASVNCQPGHFEISASEYANPMNKGAFVNKLGYVILAALEIDVHFNVNVITGSDGILRGAPGGHPDAAQGAKCTIIVAPLIRNRMAIVCDRVVTVTTPGEDVDVLVTDYGIAVNPRRHDLAEQLQQAGISLTSIEELRDIAYQIAGKPDPLEFGERVVALVEARDGTLLDVVRQIHSFHTY